MTLGTLADSKIKKLNWVDIQFLSAKHYSKLRAFGLSKPARQNTVVTECLVIRQMLMQLLW